MLIKELTRLESLHERYQTGNSEELLVEAILNQVKRTVTDVSPGKMTALRIDDSLVRNSTVQSIQSKIANSLHSD